MNFNFHTNHRLLLISIFVGFLSLSLIIAVFPAKYVQDNNPPLANKAFTSPEIASGLKVFVAEGCVGCHTQQVRNIATDKFWGKRPSIPADFADNKRQDLWRSTPSLLGTERTGPDLTNVGSRQGEVWHYIHLYNPRAVVPESIMPSYPWLFKVKDKAGPGDEVVNVPEAFKDSPADVIVASQRAEHLVAYLNSLKQTEIPKSSTPEFIEYDWMKKEAIAPVLATAAAAGSEENREELLLDNRGPKDYERQCQACHQANGEGIPGAFPPLKGSAIVLDKSPDQMIGIILNGFDRENNYGAMPGLGQLLTDEQVAAIVNYERNHWGNKAPKTTVARVKEIRDQTAKNP